MKWEKWDFCWKELGKVCKWSYSQSSGCTGWCCQTSCPCSSSWSAETQKERCCFHLTMNEADIFIRSDRNRKFVMWSVLVWAVFALLFLSNDGRGVGANAFSRSVLVPSSSLQLLQTKRGSQHKPSTVSVMASNPSPRCPDIFSQPFMCTGVCVCARACCFETV